MSSSWTPLPKSEAACDGGGDSRKRKCVAGVCVPLLQSAGDAQTKYANPQSQDKRVHADQKNEYWCHQSHDFVCYSTELDIANGSPEFHAFRKGKVSASRIGAVCGLNAWRGPAYVAAHYFDPPDPNNPHLIRGVQEEPLVRAKLFEVTGRNMPIRQCGIFAIPNTPFSAMPDDIGWCPVLGQEVILEYKRPLIPKPLPYLDYICQTVWQMGVVGLRHAFLVTYAAETVNKREPGAAQFQIWHIGFDQDFYDFMRVRAGVFMQYVDDPRPQNLPQIPHLGPVLDAHFKKGLWVPGHAFENLPPAPLVERWQPHQFFESRGEKRLRTTHIDTFMKPVSNHSRTRDAQINEYMKVVARP